MVLIKDKPGIKTVVFHARNEPIQVAVSQDEANTAANENVIYKSSLASNKRNSYPLLSTYINKERKNQPCLRINMAKQWNTSFQINTKIQHMRIATHDIMTLRVRIDALMHLHNQKSQSKQVKSSTRFANELNIHVIYQHQRPSSKDMQGMIDNT